MQFLEFEKPIIEIEEKIKALKKIQEYESHINLFNDIKKLEKKKNDKIKKIFFNLNEWQMIQMARHPMRPYAIDYIERSFTDFQELRGDRVFQNDTAIIAGLARINKEPVMVIGQQKGRTTKEKIYRNFGMPHPEGYRKSLRLMKLAERFKLPVITLIDTPGAYPGIQAEERGQSIAIANNLISMVKLKIPIINLIIGEGCSGGALGIGVGDRLLMMQYSYFAAISPEGCATILWKDIKKAPKAAKKMGITPNRLFKNKLVDFIIKEPLGGANRNYQKTADKVKKILFQEIKTLNKLTIHQLLNQRYERIMNFGIS